MYSNANALVVGYRAWSVYVVSSMSAFGDVVGET